LNVILTDATTAGGGAATETAAVAVFPDAVAVIIAFPALRAVTRPAADTLATMGFEDVHVTAALGTAFPPASYAVALSWRVPPAGICMLAGEIATEAIVWPMTVMLACAASVPDVAWIVAIPGLTPVTTPAPFTAATDGFDEPQLMG
jgi:hypothetical protein